jgi:hypothetical protein
LKIDEEKFFRAKSEKMDEKDMDSKVNDSSLDLSQKATYCDKIIQSLIRKCWTQNPKERPNFFEICSLLSNKIQHDYS